MWLLSFSSNVSCSLKSGKGAPFYSSSRMVWRRYTWKHVKPPPANRLRTAWGGWAWGAPPRVRLHLGVPAPWVGPRGHRLRMVGLALGLNLLCGCGWAWFCSEMGFLYLPWFVHFWNMSSILRFLRRFVHFHVFNQQNNYTPKLMEILVKKP